MDNEENMTVGKPRNIFSDAIKAVKGENTNQLIEQFTAEMTLVAEGLCEDQNKLRGDIDRAITEEDRRVQSLESRISLLETTIKEEQRNHEETKEELRSRIADIEKKKNQERKNRGKAADLFRQLTILAGIIGGAWVIVTIINKCF